MAAMSGHLEIVKFLVQAGAELQKRDVVGVLSTSHGSGICGNVTTCCGAPSALWIGWMDTGQMDKCGRSKYGGTGKSGDRG
jgi:hypothetical protein